MSVGFKLNVVKQLSQKDFIFVRGDSREAKIFFRIRLEVLDVDRVRKEFLGQVNSIRKPSSNDFFRELQFFNVVNFGCEDKRRSASWFQGTSWFQSAIPSLMRSQRDLDNFEWNQSKPLITDCMTLLLEKRPCGMTTIAINAESGDPKLDRQFDWECCHTCRDPGKCKTHETTA